MADAIYVVPSEWAAKALIDAADFGDASALADPSVVDHLLTSRLH